MRERRREKNGESDLMKVYHIVTYIEASPPPTTLLCMEVGNKDTAMQTKLGF